MGLTIDQAKAFHDRLVSNPTLKAHVEAQLGIDAIPKVKDFDSQDSDTLNRCETFLRYIDQCVGVLWASICNRPRQGTFDFKGELPQKKPSDQKKPAEPKAKKTQPKKAAKKKSQPKKTAKKKAGKK